MKSISIFIASVFVFGLTTIALAQDTVVTRNSDGTLTVVEYPMGREINVNLRPTSSFRGRGKARVVRSSDGTKVVFDLNGLPTTTSSYYAYAVDPSGTPTLLGPVTVTNGVARADFTTPMDKFMIVLSPTDRLTAVSSSDVVLMSEVPAGLTVVPSGSTVMTMTTTTTTTGMPVSDIRYDVPLLGISSFGSDAKTATLHFQSGDLQGLGAKAHIRRHDKETSVKVEFDDLNKVSPSKRFVLWAYTPDGRYTRLGQLYNFRNRNEAKIEARTSLTDFGLFMTVEDADVAVPTSSVWSTFRIS